MSQKTLIIVVGVLVVALAVQSYMLFTLNDKVSRLSDDGSASIELAPILPKPLLPKPGQKPFPDQWDPYAEMERMQKEMEQIFGDSFSRLHMNTPLGSFNKTPEVDLQETANSYIVTANIPGADESTLDVKVENDVLTILVKTEKLSKQSGNQDQYQRRERFVGQFQRSMTLPGPVDAARMSSEYQKGVLTIILPKSKA